MPPDDTLRKPLEDALGALLVLRTEAVEREARLHAAIDQQIKALRSEVAQAQHGVAALLRDARTRLDAQAQQALTPIATEFGQATNEAVLRLQRAGRVLWTWFIAAAGVLSVAVLAAWMLLAQQRRELAEVQAQLQRYEDALPVLTAFYASDAVVCGERICVDVEAGRPPRGLAERYRQAKPRTP